MLVKTPLDRAFLDRIDFIVPFFPIKEQDEVGRILDLKLSAAGWKDLRPTGGRRSWSRRSRRRNQSDRWSALSRNTTEFGEKSSSPTTDQRDIGLTVFPP